MIITVAGGTGTVGRELLRLLSEARAPTRAFFRDPTEARPLRHVAWIRVDLRESDLLEPALAGTSRLFLLTGNEPGFGKLQIETLRAAQELGVAHVVKQSALGASDHSRSWIGREHWDVEQALQRTTMKWTILRPHAFMQNWLGEVADSVRAKGVFSSPIGEGRVPFIDTRDIAAVAAEVLLHPEAHGGRKYVLTGGEAVGFSDVARALSETTGTRVSYRPISMEEARRRMEAHGSPPAAIEALLAIAAYQKAGGPTAVVSDDAERILGRPQRTIVDFARDHVETFRATGSPRDDNSRPRPESRRQP